MLTSFASKRIKWSLLLTLTVVLQNMKMGQILVFLIFFAGRLSNCDLRYVFTLSRNCNYLIFELFEVCKTQLTPLHSTTTAVDYSLQFTDNIENQNNFNESVPNFPKLHRRFVSSFFGLQRSMTDIETL